MKSPVFGACRWFAAAALALACGSAAAQEYPSRPIRFLLPFAPGGIEAQVVPFKGTPRTVVVRLNKEIVTALGSPEVKLKLSALGAEPYPSTPEQTRERMRSEIARWKAVIERANIPRQ